MAPSIDYAAVPSLLCSEDDESIFYDDFDLVEEFGYGWNGRNQRTNNQNQIFIDEECFTGYPMLSDECLALLVKSECEHLPAGDYLRRLKNGELDLEAREVAIDWIKKAHAHFNFGPVCAYLSINYMDRFLSAYELPKGKTWMNQLLAVACLSLAAKMEENEVPLSLDLQVSESKFVFEARTIQRMELLVLSTLKWRMQAVTPFSFIDYFLTKIIGDQITSRSSIFKSTERILSTINGINFLEFRPSEIAAAVAMYVSRETRTLDSEKTLSVLTQHVEKGRVVECMERLRDLSMFGGSIKGLNASNQSVPQSPIGVLDAACLSYKTDESCANSSYNSPDPKRRKQNRPYEMD